MAELQNNFSWSHSASKDFADCPRKRYWSKYAKWGGWNRNATDLQKQVYRLDKMSNRYALMGEAAEDTAMWILRQKQKGIDVTADEAFTEVARGFLRSKWNESLKREWESSPKKCSLHEHYYTQFVSKTDRELVIEVADQVKLCLANFIEIFLPRFAEVKPDQEVPITLVGMGDPEHFMFEGVKIYAIPDYVYRDGDMWHIHDWKAGKLREEHHHQLGVYALWANEKHGVPVENIRVSLEYLSLGETISASISAEDLDRVRAGIRESVGDMTGYLEGADMQKNIALPLEDWDLTIDGGPCKFCNFFELCEAELKELQIFE